MTLTHSEKVKEKISTPDLKFVKVEGTCCWQVRSRRRLLVSGGNERKYYGQSGGRQDNRFAVKSLKIIDCPQVP